MLVLHKGSPLLCTLMASGKWSYRAQSISSICSKKVHVKQKTPDENGISKMLEHRDFP